MKDAALPGVSRSHAQKQADHAEAKLWTRDFVLVTLGNGLFFSTVFFLMPILPLYVVSLGGSESQVGLVVSAGAVSGIVVRLFVGSAVDRWGTKRFLIAGSLGLVVGTALLIWSTAVGTVMSIRVIQGAALALFTTAAGTLAAQIAPPARRAEGLGWFGLSGNVAMAIGPVISGLIAGAFGFVGVFSGGALMAGFAVLIAMALGGSAKDGPDIATAKPSYRWIRLNRTALFPSLVLVTVTFGLGGMMTFVPIRGIQLGIENVGFFYMTMALSQIVSRVSTGRLADRFGRFAVIFPSFVSITCGLVTLAFAESARGLMMAAALFGIGWGALIPAIMALAIDRVDEKERGSAMATFFAALDTGVALGTGLLGLIIERTSFFHAFMLAASFAVMGVGALLIDHRRSRNGGQVQPS